MTHSKRCAWQGVKARGPAAQGICTNVSALTFRNSYLFNRSLSVGSNPTDLSHQQGVVSAFVSILTELQRLLCDKKVP